MYHAVVGGLCVTSLPGFFQGSRKVFFFGQRFAPGIVMDFHASRSIRSSLCHWSEKGTTA